MSGLPEIVSRLLGKVLPSIAETCQFKTVSQVSGYGGTTIEYGGKLPPRIAEVTRQPETLMPIAGNTSSRKDFPGWGGSNIGMTSDS